MERWTMVVPGPSDGLVGIWHGGATWEVAASYTITYSGYGGLSYDALEAVTDYELPTLGADEAAARIRAGLEQFMRDET